MVERLSCVRAYNRIPSVSLGPLSLKLGMDLIRSWSGVEPAKSPSNFPYFARMSG